MANHAGYADDFEAFRRQGEIGLMPALRIVPAQPEIGSTVEVEVCGVEQGQLRCSSGAAWPVIHGSRVHLQVMGRVQLQLLDERGRPAAQAVIEPYLERPVLHRWDLPPCVGWDTGRWAVPVPQAGGAQSLRLQWRWADEQHWQAVPPDGCLPLPAARARVHLQAELRSRHAEWSQDAVVVVNRAVEIVAPTPVLVASAGAVALQCHRARRLQFTALHVRGFQLILAGQVVAMAAGDGQLPLHLAHDVVPKACGSLPLQLVATDLENRRVLLLELALPVQPRPVQVEVLPCVDEADTVCVQVEGAQVHLVVVPLTGERIADVPARFRVTLRAMGGADLLLELQDDAGAWSAQPLRLDPPPVAWPMMPGWSELPPAPWWGR